MKWRPIAIAVVMTACTPPIYQSTGGSGGAGSTTSSMSTTSSQVGSGSTSSAASTSTSSGSASSTGGAGSSTAIATTGIGSTNSASSSTGGPTDLPYCAPISDDFDSYGSDSTFMAVGETSGPWAEHGYSTMSVRLMGSSILTRSDNGQLGTLAFKSGIQITSTCALTVELRQPGGGGGASAFGLANANGSKYYGIVCNDAMGGLCRGLEAFGYQGNNLQGQNLYLGLVIKNNHLYAFYDDGSGWQPVVGAPSNGQDDGIGLLGQPVYAYFGELGGNNDTSTWDDFDIRPIPSDVVP